MTVERLPTALSIRVPSIAPPVIFPDVILPHVISPVANPVLTNHKQAISKAWMFKHVIFPA